MYIPVSLKENNDGLKNYTYILTKKEKFKLVYYTSSVKILVSELKLGI